MQYRTLGATGVQVSELCLGTMAFGSLGNADHDECVAMIHRALDAGVNLVDTADVYSAGEAETIVGRALAGRREDVVVATKGFWPMGADPNERGSSRRWLVRAVEASLRRLETDRIDVYFLHKPDHATDIEESLGALDDLVREGKVLTVGISTFPAERIVEAHWAAERGRVVRPRVEQPPYSLLYRSPEAAVLPTCDRYGMGVMVWGPLNWGWLTGKYRGGAPEGSRGDRWRGGPSGRVFDTERPAAARKADLVDALDEVAHDLGRPLTHLAVAFTLAHPAVTSSIIGPRTPVQLDDLLGAADLRLDDEVLGRIDDIVAPGRDVDPEADAGYRPPELADPRLRRR